MIRKQIYDECTKHRIAMDHKYGKNSLPNLNPSDQMVILMEEVGEMARAILERDRDQYKAEAKDVMQVIVAILEGL